MSPLSRRFGAVSTLALATALATPVAAQTADEGVFTMLGRIILAAGRARVAIDTPQAVTALDSEDIEREQASTPGDLLRAVPGASSFGGGAMTGQFLNIRGIGTSSASDENRIIVSIDGVQKYFEQYRVGSHFGEPELYRRVEVLRGPGASLLHGSGAIGGVVAFETRQASDFLSEGETTALRLRAGGHDNGSGSFGSAILAHRFSDRVEMLAAITTRQEGDYDAGGGALVPGTNMSAQSALVSGSWLMSDESEQRLSFSASRWRTEGDQVPYSAYGDFSVFGTVDRTVTDDTAQVTWENPASDNPWIDARVQLSFSRSEVDQSNAQGYPGYPFAPPYSIFQDSIYAYEGVTLNARNTITAEGERWQNYLTFGGQIATRDREQVSGGSTLGSHPAGNSDGYGLFLQNELVLSEDLTLLGALRYDYSSLTATAGADPSLLNMPVTHSGLAGSLAAHYTINEAWSVFGTYASTTRLPTIDEMFDSGTSGGTASLGLRPEHARTIELGATWQGRDIIAAGDGLDVKLTAFNNQFQDRIERVSIAGQPSFQNIGRARIRGVEIEASYESDLWFGRFAASAIEGLDQTTNLRLNSTPAHQAMLEIGRRLPEQNLELGWRGTFVAGASLASGERFAGHSLHDVFMTWRPDQGAFRDIEVQLSVNNIFDVEHYNILDGAQATSRPRPGRDIRLTLGRTISF
ncbi:TonB-dependent receptor domain-containing protein [Pararhodobacter oceanensis]|uniref:Hemin receptor protein HmuR n=1 Tax=Pararhodobacter oceanensis TaxID=2172121 RepID=A0A2T8HZ65_9RHOB|nr:TonB-dependent receptor [Pararhodobacter oceanensis]PVH30726.1 hemin receptor protein HmuR [Pararhodobacter oceanensis]